MAKKIAVIGFSSYSHEGSLRKGVDRLESHGFTVDIADQVYKKCGQNAGTIQDKIEAFHAACNDPSVSMIMASCGGNGAVHLLPHIDLSLCTKPIIGFSDTTTIINATPHGGIHGSTLEHLGRDLSREQEDHFINILHNKISSLTWQNCTIQRAGQVTGKRLYGGNISAFQTLLGTSFMPDCHDAILFFEDCHEETSRIDRMLGHFANAGLFDNAAALLFGQFLNMTDTGKKPYILSIEAIIERYSQYLTCPVVMNAPFGHGSDLWALPIGCKIDLNITDHDVHITFTPYQSEKNSK